MKYLKCNLSALLICFLISTSHSIAQKDHIKEYFDNYGPQYDGVVHEKFLFSENDSLTYKISVYLPPTYPEKDEYPVLVLTDAAYALELTAGILETLWYFHEAEEVVLVGIGYPYSSLVEWQRQRIRDMMHTKVEGFNPSGQAKEFVAFMEKKLFPYLDKNFKVDLSDKCFSGHSAGGLLGAYILVEHSNLFNKYIIGSPSLWWDQAEIIERAKPKDEWANSEANIFTYVGGSEGETKLKNWNKFNSRIKENGGGKIKLVDKLYENESHMSVVPDALPDALKYFYQIKK